MRIKIGAVVPAVAIALLGVFVSAAHADLKLEQTVETKGIDPFTLFLGGDPPSGAKTKRKTTTYYKGDKRRVEQEDVIRLYDDTKNTITFLDPKAKTYFVLDLTKQSIGGDTSALPEFDGAADVQQTADTKTISGKEAHHYLYTVTIKMSLPGSKTPLVTFTLKGDQWTTEAVATNASNVKQQGISLLAALPSEFSKGLKPISEKMATIKGFVLEENQTTSYTSIIVTGAPNVPFESLTKTTAVSEDALVDTLFAVPTDFKQVDPPSNPGSGKK